MNPLVSAILAEHGIVKLCRVRDIDNASSLSAFFEYSVLADNNIVFSRRIAYVKNIICVSLARSAGVSTCLTLEMSSWTRVVWS